MFLFCRPTPRWSKPENEHDDEHDNDWEKGLPQSGDTTQKPGTSGKPGRLAYLTYGETYSADEATNSAGKVS
jgi:hypothetical protein